MQTQIIINGRTFAISTDHADGSTHPAAPGRPITASQDALRRLNHLRSVAAAQAQQRGITLPGLRRASMPLAGMAARTVVSAEPNRRGLVVHLGGAR